MMPLIVKWPGVTKPDSRSVQMVQNLDYAQTFLEMAGAEIPSNMQGRSLVPILKNGKADDWRKSIYYHYYEAGGHGVPAHFGVRDERYKLMHFPRTKEWNLVDLKEDPQEMQSFHDDPAYKETLDQMRSKLSDLQKKHGVETSL